MLRKPLRLSLICSTTLLAVLVIWPYHDRVLRLGLPLGLAMMWVTLLLIGWSRPWKWLLLCVPVLAVIPFCLPGKAYQAGELRGDYVAAMKEMKGTRYLWGGESRRGIDCSGLPRRALRNALWDEGWEHLNGRAFRDWAEQWWYDTSAKALSENYRGFTHPLGITGRLRDLDFKRLEPGDLAVTTDGRHVMIYIGEDEWIQADPGLWQVAVGRPASEPNPWFDREVTLHRWTLLGS